MTDFALQFIPEAVEPPKLGENGLPEGYFVNPNTGQVTSRELLRNAHQDRSRFQAATSGAARGITFGGVDELAGAAHAARGLFQGQDLGEAYTFGREKARAMIEADRENYPGTQILTELASALSLPLGYFQTAGKGASLARTAAEGAAIGGVTGGAYGFLDAEGGARERLEQARTGATVGAAVGGAAGALIPGATRAAQRRADRKSLTELAKTAPTEDEMRRASQQLYQYLESRGIVLDDQSYNAFVGKLQQTITDEGADKVLTPTASRALERMQKALGEGPITLKRLDTLRKVANSLPKTAADADKRLVSIITEQIDDYVRNLADGDVVAGQIEGVGDDIAKARELWSRMKSSQRISQAIEAAEDTASGFENGLRIEFRKIIKDKRVWSKMSEAEKRAVREVTQGTTLGNFLKRMSKIGFGRGQQTSVLSGTVASGAGAALGFGLGGPVGSAVGTAVPGILGKVGSVGAERLTNAAAQRSRALAAAGGVAPVGRASAVTPNALRLIERSAPLQNAINQPR